MNDIDINFKLSSASLKADEVGHDVDWKTHTLARKLIQIKIEESVGELVGREIQMALMGILDRQQRPK